MEQDHLTRLVVGTEDEDLGHERTDLLGWKVHDRDHEATDELGGTIVASDLSAGALDAERAEVDPELVGMTAGLWEVAGVRHHAHANVHHLARLPRDRKSP